MKTSFVSTRRVTVSAIIALWIGLTGEAVATAQSGPVVKIMSPVRNEMISEDSIAIVGTAAWEGRFYQYELHWGRGAEPTSWSLIASGTTPIVDGSLGTLSFLDTAENLATLRLTVFGTRVEPCASTPGTGDPDYRLTLSPLIANPLEPLTVTWTAPADRGGHPTDWIGLFLQGAPNTTYGKWFYATTSTGTGTLAASETPGVYEARYLLDNGFTSAARSNTVCVGGPTATELVPVRLLRFSTPSASQRVFSPNADAINDTTTLSTTSTFPVSWMLTIKDSTQAVVKTFTGTGQTISQVWDGIRAGGMAVPDGRYTYQFSGTSTETGVSRASAEGQVTVDVASPQAIITAPSPRRELFDEVVITGTAADANFSSYELSVGDGENPTTWTILQSSSSSVQNGRLGTWQTRSSKDGPYVVRLVVTDQSGNTTRVTQPVTVDNVITDVFTNPVGIDPIVGETCTISYKLNRAGNVTVRIYDSLTKVAVRTLIQDAPRSMGIQGDVWNGMNDAGKTVNPGAYYVIVGFKDSQARNRTSDDPSSPSIGPTPLLSNSVMNATDFNPFRNDRVKIDFDLSTPGRLKIQVISASGREPIRTLLNRAPLAAGHHTLFWDGRRNNGALYQGGFNVFFDVPEPLEINPIIVMPQDSQVEQFLTEPYVIQPLFGEVSRVVYSLSRPAEVTATLQGPNGNHFKTLVDHRSQTVGSHTIEWDGTDDKGLLPSVEGDYTVDVKATDSETGVTVDRTGVVLVYR